MLMIKTRLLSLLTVLLLASGCATSVTQDILVDTDADPKTNFSAYNSYTWLGSASVVYDAKGKWEPPSFDADAEIKYLIDRELRKRGMVEDSVSPDMIVVFAAGVDMDVQQYKVDPKSDIDILENVPLGALSVVLVDAETEIVIWAGLATAEIQEEPTSEVVKKRLDYAVTTMLKELPR
jgi:hypothetical protein